MDFPYRIVRAAGGFWLWFFFKSIEVRHPERVPETEAALLAINHPNNLIDSLVIGAVTGWCGGRRSDRGRRGGSASCA